MSVGSTPTLQKEWSCRVVDPYTTLVTPPETVFVADPRPAGVGVLLLWFCPGVWGSVYSRSTPSAVEKEVLRGVLPVALPESPDGSSFESLRVSGQTFPYRRSGGGRVLPAQ